MNPHVWTENEIGNLPQSPPGQGWFYGLVLDPENNDKILLSQIYPGLGYIYLQKSQIDSGLWSRAVKDIEMYRP